MAQDERRLSRSARRNRARLERARSPDPSAADRFRELCDANEKKRREAVEGWKPPAFIMQAVRERAGSGPTPLKRCDNCKAGRHHGLDPDCKCECPGA